MKIPHAERAEVDPRKLVDYCLSPNLEPGRHKAVVFEAALGIMSVDAFVLRGWLPKAVSEREAVIEQSDEFGQRYRIEFNAVTTSGRATIRSAWIIRAGVDFPRLTTCFIIPQ